MAAPLQMRADGWSLWGYGGIYYTAGGTAGAQLANDGTNVYFSTELSGVWTAPLASPWFYPLSMNGFPAWDPNLNTNGMAVCSLGISHGTVVIGGEVVNVTNNLVDFGSAAAKSNALPVFYWWDDTNLVWQAATITGKSYPYTVHVGNFCNAPDGSLWTCSGYASYVYRSTDDGHSYTAFDINASVPASYSPQPFNGTNSFSAGKIFGLAIGTNGEVVIGTETAGFLHSLDNGLSWTSLDPNYTNINSTNPLGRAGDARVAGLDRLGDFICGIPEYTSGSAAQNQWSGVASIFLYHPADGSYVPAKGFQGNYGISQVVTTPCGISFCDLDQGTNLLGGVYLSIDGTNWIQYNTNLPAVSTNVGNALAPGGCITTVSNLVIIGGFYACDASTLSNSMFLPVVPAGPPVTNFPPVALPQNFVLSANSSVSFALASVAASGDPLNYALTTSPVKGSLSGTPPALTYTPTNGAQGLDQFRFTVDDGVATSAPVPVNFAINNPTSQVPVLSFQTSAPNGWLINPSNLVLTATASAPGGINQIRFYDGTNQLAFFHSPFPNPPYTYTWTNPPAGDHFLFARVGDNQEASIWSAPLEVSVLTAYPQIAIQPADATDVNVIWSGNTNGFYLFTAPDPAGPWSLCRQPPVFTNLSATVTIFTADRQYFRLLHP